MLFYLWGNHGIIMLSTCTSRTIHICWWLCDYYSIEKTIQPPSGHALVDLVHLVLGQDVASLLSLCMTEVTAQMAARLTLRSFKRENRKVSIIICEKHTCSHNMILNTWTEDQELLRRLYPWYKFQCTKIIHSTSKQEHIRHATKMRQFCIQIPLTNVILFDFGSELCFALFDFVCDEDTYFVFLILCVKSNKNLTIPICRTKYCSLLALCFKYQKNSLIIT